MSSVVHLHVGLCGWDCGVFVGSGISGSEVPSSSLGYSKFLSNGTDCWCFRLARCAVGVRYVRHGRRRAVWLEAWDRPRERERVQTGSASSALLAGLELRGLCQGDDFLLVVARPALEEFDARLSTKFERRRTRRIGNVEGCAMEKES